MADNFEVQGLKEVEMALKELPAKLQASVLRATNRKLVKNKVVDPLRSYLSYSRNSEKNILIVNDRSDPTALYGGVTSGSFWLRFADRGTKERKTEKGASKGSIKGKNQIQPFILGTVDDIIKSANNELGLIVEDVLRKRIKSTKGKLLKMIK